MIKITKLSNGGELHETDSGKFYYLNNMFHRKDGPAVEYNWNETHWYLNGKLHREDGPAIEYYDHKRWYINDKAVACNSQKEFERLMRLKAFW
jgi:hypothetical protein